MGRYVARLATRTAGPKRVDVYRVPGWSQLLFLSYRPGCCHSSFLAGSWLQERPRLQQHLPGMLCCMAAALLVAAPLGIYFLQNPLAFSTRIGQVTTGIGREEVFVNLGDVLRMFLLSGDHNPTRNLPFRPVLGPFLALPFLRAWDGRCTSAAI